MLQAAGHLLLRPPGRREGTGLLRGQAGGKRDDPFPEMVETDSVTPCQPKTHFVLSLLPELLPLLSPNAK